MSIPEHTIYVIDKFILKTHIETRENISRNYLLMRLTEALAEALEQNAYDVEKIEIRVIGKERTTSIILYVKKVVE